jgi:NADPH-dependent F420 reductase
VAGDVEVVGLLGGTGPAGTGLAVRLAAAGLRVLVGSREQDRAEEVVAGLLGDWPDRGLDLVGVANEEACDADVVVMAAPWEPALQLAGALADRLAGTPVVSMANALARVDGNFLPLTMPRGSVCQELAARLPDSDVVGAYHHLPAKHMGDLDHELGCEVLVCGGSVEARNVVIDLTDRVQGLHALDAGTLDSAGAIEAMTAVLVQVNVRYRTHSMLRLVGNFD